MKKILAILGLILLIGFVTATDPVANFTSNVTIGFAPLDVQFNDTSTTDATAWNWSFTNITPGNNTAVWWSTDQNATYTFGEGNWNIHLNVTNASGYNISPSDYWVNASPVSWIYSTNGTYNWTCPAGVTDITLIMSGGGGSGQRGFYANGYNYHAGGGGYRGEYLYQSGVTVVPGTNYSLVIGKGGLPIATQYASQAGNASTAFGFTADGGPGGIDLAQAVVIGGDGESGYVTTDRYSQNGTAGMGAGGTGGLGGGAGGGGSSPLGTVNGGGYGAPGVVAIYATTYTGSNTANFVADVTSGVPGQLVRFTNTSTIVNSTNLAFNWSFGDGQYSETIGDVVHVYSYTGTYDVSLTITSTGSLTVTETKESYIIISTTETNYILPTQPKSVRFKIVDAYGNDLPGALVTANYINTSLPSTSTSWLVSAFGVSSTVAGEMMNSGIAMQGTTGSDGGLSFIMYPVLEYGLTITNATAGLSKYVTVYPQDTDYTIYCPLTSQIAPVSKATYLYNSSLYVTEPNASFITWNLLYSDTSGDTTALDWNVTCWNNKTVMHTNSWGAVGAGTVIVDNYTFPSEPKGMEYRAIYHFTRTI